MRTGGICKLACKFRDKRLTAYIFIYLFHYLFLYIQLIISFFISLFIYHLFIKASFPTDHSCPMYLLYLMFSIELVPAVNSFLNSKQQADPEG